jgi:2-oxoglutarate dehydrogenase E1 component
MEEPTAFFASYGQNAGYVQELFELYRTDRTLVPAEWAAKFDAFWGDESPSYTNGTTTYRPHTNGSNGFHQVAAAPSVSADLQERAFKLVRAYRERGHLRAKVNPVSKGVLTPPTHRELQVEQYGFTASELSTEVNCERFQGTGSMKLGELISALDSTYCGSIGAEFSHILDPEAREFVRERFEARALRGTAPDAPTQKRILQKLIDAEAMESELHRKYVGQKRFSLQGGELLIPMLDVVLSEGANSGVHEAVIGMAHRGRLNVLTNTIGKPLSQLFNEFEDQSVSTVLGSGDVKYHLGYSGTHTAPNGSTLKVSMAPNPSHLEFVNPVLEGLCRARQDIAYNHERTAVLPVLIHGDAAVIGQGVVFETFNLSALSGYATGGSLHIVINNQVGFTTNPEESRSTVYCSDLAKCFEAPVFHVNGEDPEAAAWVMELALKYRNRFARDVVIDLICYRKYGHNEGDDPSFTQPILYSEISAKRTPAALYTETLVARGVISEADAKAMHEEYLARFKAADGTRKPGAEGDACPLHGRLHSPEPKTAVKADTIRAVAKTLVSYPEGFTPHPKLQKILEKRVESLDGGKAIDWGFAEGLGFGTLLLEGRSVRLSGQDCGRGTFSQRHLVLSHHDEMSRFVPFESLAKTGGARLEILNSPLSEAAVLGFEFGYSSIATDGLTLWEAQFGDFANGAQVHIDQFIASSEAKWGQRSGVVMLLPHGYEGQGPEHSSARLERYLQLCAEGNMTVCYPTSAAQQFHLVRRHALTEIKRPLIVMTPKSLLRHPGAASELSELTDGGFQRVIVDNLGKGKESKAVVLVTGKVFYDLAAALDKQSGAKVKVVRLEELYPFPEQALSQALQGSKPERVLWVQEEPQNMGAWSFVSPYLTSFFGQAAQYIGRPAAASPATGSSKAHAREQQAIISAVLEAI